MNACNRGLIVLIWILCPAASGMAETAEWSEMGSALFATRDVETMRVSSSDPDWQGGNDDYRPIAAGQTLTIADVEGPGIVRHIWFTINAEDPRYGRSLTLRMYWDGATEPAVESPIGDFFAVGHGALRMVDSLPVSVTSDGRAMNCYWPMPFAKRACITLSNDSPKYAVRNAYWYVDYEKVPELPANTTRFHAQYRQEFPAKKGENYLILDAEGRGQYVGTVLSVISRTQSWFGEGDDFFYIDGEPEPRLRGTGTEDYFCDAWGFREFNRPYYGVILLDGAQVGDRISAYRWHIQDPVRFRKSLKVTMEHKGVMRNHEGRKFTQFHERADLYSSVAFWYQTPPCKRFATLPPVDQRLPPRTTVEFEQYQKEARVEPADTAITTDRHGQASGGVFLIYRFTGRQGRLTLPFKLDRHTTGIARLHLGAGPDGGKYSVMLDGKPLAALPSVNLHAPKLGMVQFRVGPLDLAAGEHVLTFESQGGCAAAQGHELDLDALIVDEVTPYAVEAESK